MFVEREDTEYTYLEYTEKWVCAFDRGGLFHSYLRFFLPKYECFYINW